MHKMVVLYHPPTDPEVFKQHYLGTHIPLVEQLPGLLSMRYTFDVRTAGHEPGFFAVFEGEFADADAMRAALASPQGQAVSADVPKYATGGAIILDYPVDGS
ncbi:uncharacterized protein (TIGR02118 family) [Saccharomonospora amisosensis]|uniref:Uncharacterized protein (TIGR02118 family) n=1 Tax=Saccharomonospora amisosensis TaxID=1128677 RepID=A0A7X5ULI5_9PSEU|nr:EthD family reductase [Saccharomonospora amisosensis]NIJ09907.1 uncharacterized protein (TIGR02118 family) [Saccharomonospora amisosensis]